MDFLCDFAQVAAMSEVYFNQINVRRWQFLLLKFAISREPDHQREAEVAAQDLDVGSAHSAESFTYFSRSTVRFCAAVSDPANHENIILIRSLAAQIDNKRLRNALLSSVGLQECGSRRTRMTLQDRQNLWRKLK